MKIDRQDLSICQNGTVMEQIKTRHSACLSLYMVEICIEWGIIFDDSHTNGSDMGNSSTSPTKAIFHSQILTNDTGCTDGMIRKLGLRLVMLYVY